MKKNLYLVLTGTACLLFTLVTLTACKKNDSGTRIVPDSLLLTALVGNEGDQRAATISAIMRDRSVVPNVRLDAEPYRNRIHSIDMIHNFIYVVFDDPGHVQILDRTYRTIAQIDYKGESTRFQDIVYCDDGVLALSDASLRSIFLVDEIKSKITDEIPLNRLPGRMECVGRTLYAAADDCICVVPLGDWKETIRPGTPYEIDVPARRDSKLGYYTIYDEEDEREKAKIWALSAGQLCLVDVETKTAERTLSLSGAGIDASNGFLQMDKEKKNVYFNAVHNGRNAIYRVPVYADELPAGPLFYCDDVQNLTAMELSASGTFFVCDAKDGISDGYVYEYDMSGKVAHRMKVGVEPSVLFLL